MDYRSKLAEFIKHPKWHRLIDKIADAAESALELAAKEQQYKIFSKVITPLYVLHAQSMTYGASVAVFYRGKIDRQTDKQETPAYYMSIPIDTDLDMILMLKTKHDPAGLVYKTKPGQRNFYGAGVVERESGKGVRTVYLEYVDWGALFLLEHIPGEVAQALQDIELKIEFQDAEEAEKKTAFTDILDASAELLKED